MRLNTRNVEFEEVRGEVKSVKRTAKGGSLAISLKPLNG